LVSFALLVILAWAVVRFAVLERKTRDAWTRVPLKRRITKTPYRGESVPLVAGFYARAPRVIRLVALGSSVFGLLAPLEWLLSVWQRVPPEGARSSAWAAARALLARDKNAPELARRASEIQTLVQVVLASVVFSTAPMLVMLGHPIFVAVCILFVVTGALNTWMLARVAKNHEEAFGEEPEVFTHADAEAGGAATTEDVPEWLTRALVRRAESRGPRLRVAEGEAHANADAGANADANADAGANADPSLDGNGNADVDVPMEDVELPSKKRLRR
jgi:hypothetical protein